MNTEKQNIEIGMLFGHHTESTRERFTSLKGAFLFGQHTKVYETERGGSQKRQTYFHRRT